MTTFYVVGISPSQMRTRATATVEDEYGQRGGIELMRERIDAEVERLVKTGKIGQISPYFDAEQFARDWMVVAAAAGCTQMSLHVRHLPPPVAGRKAQSDHRIGGCRARAVRAVGVDMRGAEFVRWSAWRVAG